MSQLSRWGKKSFLDIDVEIKYNNSNTWLEHQCIWFRLRLGFAVKMSDLNLRFDDWQHWMISKRRVCQLLAESEVLLAFNVIFFIFWKEACQLQYIFTFFFFAIRVAYISFNSCRKCETLREVNPRKEENNLLKNSRVGPKICCFSKFWTTNTIELEKQTSKVWPGVTFLLPPSPDSRACAGCASAVTTVVQQSLKQRLELKRWSLKLEIWKLEPSYVLTLTGYAQCSLGWIADQPQAE